VRGIPQFRHCRPRPRLIHPLHRTRARTHARLTVIHTPSTHDARERASTYCSAAFSKSTRRRASRLRASHPRACARGMSPITATRRVRWFTAIRRRHACACATARVSVLALLLLLLSRSLMRLVISFAPPSAAPPARELPPVQAPSHDDTVIDLRQFRARFAGTAVWMTFGTAEVREAAENWLATSRASGVDARSVLVAAFDDAFYAWCMRERLSSSDWVFTCADARMAMTTKKDALNIGIDSFRENTDAFNALMRAKVKCIEVMLRSGYNLAVSDVDVAWIRNPLEYFASGTLADVDVAVSSDSMYHFDGEAYARAERAAAGTGLQRWSELLDATGEHKFPLTLDMNVGIMYWRCTTNAIQFATDWTRALHLGTNIIDQIYFNLLSRTREVGLVRSFCKERVRATDDMRRACVHTELRLPHLGDNWPKTNLSYGSKELDEYDIEGACPIDACVRGVSDADLDGEFADAYMKGERPLYSYGGMSGSVRFAVLPTQLFANGITYFSFGHRLSPNAFAVHNTYVYGGFAGKMWRFRESGLVAGEKKTKFLTPAGEDVKVLVVRFDIPRAVEEQALSARLTPRSDVPHGHIAALTWQMNRVRDALAVARLTNRTLIIPQFLCGCQRHFHYMRNCTLGDTPLPFACPLDHVMTPLRFSEHGIRAREASYFQNRLKAGLPPFVGLAPRIAACAPGADVAACASRLPTASGELSKTAGYVPVDTPIDNSPVNISTRILRAPFNAEDVLAVFSRLADEPVVALDVVDPPDDTNAVYFSSFNTDAENDAFNRAMRAITHEACCFVNGTRPHLPRVVARPRAQHMDVT